MKAITRHRYGSVDELEFEELPLPTSGTTRSSSGSRPPASAATCGT